MQPAQHVGLAARAGFLPLARRALAEVVVLGGEPKILVPLLRNYALHIASGSARGRVVGRRHIGGRIVGRVRIIGCLIADGGHKLVGHRVARVTVGATCWILV